MVVSNDAQAAALDVPGPDHGIPDVYSAHRGYWYYRRHRGRAGRGPITSVLGDVRPLGSVEPDADGAV
jgi:hypothetical protein